MLLALVALLACASAFAQREFVRAQAIAVEALSPTVKRIRVRMPQGYAFDPAQYALVRVPEAVVEQWNARHGTSHGEVVRPYSFASDPARLPEAEFIVQLAAAPAGKDVPPGITSTYLHGLAAGDPVEISRPMGSLRPPAGVPVVMVAGGSGVAPFVGLLERWLREELAPDQHVYLYFGARDRSELLLDQTFRAWAAAEPRFHYVPAIQGEEGFVNQVLERQFPEAPGAVFLLAGSPRMMEETEKVIRSKGIPQDRIRRDPIQVR